MQEDLKACGRCGATKVLSEFHCDKGRKDGRRDYCKQCSTARNRDYYQRNKSRLAEYAKARYLANRDHAKAQMLKYRRDNLERERARYREHYAKNSESIKARVREYFRRNPHVSRAAKEKRRALKLGIECNSHKKIAAWNIAWRKKKWVVCYWCRKREIPRRCHSDHITPLSRGGLHVIENLAISCQGCNNRKYSSTLNEWNGRIDEPVLF